MKRTLQRPRRLVVGVAAGLVLVLPACTTTSKEPAPRVASNASSGTPSAVAESPSDTPAAEQSTAPAAAAGNDGAKASVAPSPLPGVTVAVAGDIACSPTDAAYKGGAGTAFACRERATSDVIVGMKPAAVLALGDLQYEAGKLSSFETSYGSTWGRFKSITYPAPGNHEYGTTGARGYYDYFGARAAKARGGYYSTDIGGWHVVSLNSNCGAIGGCQRGSAQEKWLRADLAAHPAKCTLAIWHHPRWSSGLHGSSTAVDGLWRALAEAGADLVLVGHDHHYERFAPLNADGAVDKAHGVREFVVGTGGRSLYPVLGAVTGSEVREFGTFGALKLTLEPTSYTWEFVPVAGSTFTDSGSASCH